VGSLLDWPLEAAESLLARLDGGLTVGLSRRSIRSLFDRRYDCFWPKDVARRSYYKAAIDKQLRVTGGRPAGLIWSRWSQKMALSYSIRRDGRPNEDRPIDRAMARSRHGDGFCEAALSALARRFSLTISRSKEPPLLVAVCSAGDVPGELVRRGLSWRRTGRSSRRNSISAKPSAISTSLISYDRARPACGSRWPRPTIPKWRSAAIS
jgi:hypothetical protein